MTTRQQGWGTGPWKQFGQPPVGGMAMTGNLAGVITLNPGVGTFVPIGNQRPAHPKFVLDPSDDFEIDLVPDLSPDETQFQRLKYVGSASSLCGIFLCSLSVQDPLFVAFGFAAKLQKNGVDIPGSEQEGQTGGLVTSAGSLTLQAVVTLSPDDDIRVVIANITDNGQFIVSSCHLTGFAL